MIRASATIAASVLATAILGSACGATPTDDDSTVDGVQSELANGTPTNARPEIGMVFGNFSQGSLICSGTLVAPRWVLTAAHCVNFSTANPSLYTFVPGNPNGNPEGKVASSPRFPVRKILNFGPSREADLKTTTDFSGNNDIALLLLADIVPASVVPSPASIAQAVPALGSNATTFGYGCTSNANLTTDYRKRAATWTFGTHSSGVSNYATLINSDGQLVPGMQGPSDLLVTGGHLCEGDSGGPTVTGTLAEGGEIWGVNSSGTSPFLGLDGFGAVAFLKKPICQAVYNMLIHSPCEVGAPLTIPPNGCASSQTPEQVARHTDVGIRAVCTLDPHCCQPYSEWDEFCVRRLVTLTGRPPGCSL